MINILLAATLAAFPAVAAQPGLLVSALRQEPGAVEFYLSASELPAGQKLEKISASIDGKPLTLTAEPVAGIGEQAPRRAVVLVLDTSGSMAGQALTDARQAAQTYVEQLPADVAVALVAAGEPATVVQQLTHDRAAVASQLAQLQAKGDTAIFSGVLNASSMVATGEWGQRRIVALTDGTETASRAELEALRGTVTAAKVPLDVIAWRTQESSVSGLAELASATGGQTSIAPNAAGLTTLFARSAGLFGARMRVRVTVPPQLSGQEARMRIEAEGLATEVTLQLAADTRAGGQLGEVAAARPDTATFLAIGGIVFAGMLVLALLVVLPVISGAERRRRLAQVDRFTAPKPKRRLVPEAENAGQVTQAALALSAQVVKSTNTEGRIARQLDRAGMRLRPHEWMLMRAVIALALGLLFALFFHPFWGFLLGCLAGVAVTSLYHRQRAAKRTNAFNEMLPDALQLVIGSLRAGFSLSQALDAMVKELPDPISTEFGRALGETRLGVDVEDALDRLAARAGNKDLSWAVVAIRVQREVGGNLAEVLSNTVETIREREQVRRHVQALTAEGRLSAWVLLALPLIVVTFMFAFRGDYVRPLYAHPVGILMSVTGIVLIAVGGFWLSRLIKIEV